MITRYDFGTPIDTDAVVQRLSPSASAPTRFTVTREGAAVIFRHPLAPEEMIFGLGESVKGINKRGSLCAAWASDDPSHTEDKPGLYGAHNFLVFFADSGCFGVFFDDPGRVTFDLGWTDTREAVITSENGDLSVYELEGASVIDLCRDFRQLTGRSYMPPRWAFGYIQSRWGYKTEQDILSVLEEHRARHIPLDGLSMDIDYMDDFRDFTVDPEKFPDMSALSRRLKEQHARFIPIIDAAIKFDKDYSVCAEGLEKGYFCKNEDGTPFVGAVWPGRSLFPDFMRPEVRAWFGRQYHHLMAQGAEGFWNDMNEPALFYSDVSLQNAFDITDTMKGQDLGIWETFRLKDTWLGIANNPEDFKRFWHDVDGAPVRHDRVHNLYGAMMTRAAAEGMRAFDPSRRFLLFSRSSFVGAHRNGGIWQGDNCSWWSHILLNLKQLPALNMCGFLYNGADLGGFGCNTSPELLARWLQLGVFTPLMRNHSALGTRDQEIYRFPDLWPQMRDTLLVRYALIPWLYSEFMLAACRDEMLFRPLVFDHPSDPIARGVEDQLMLGHGCMIAPIYTPNTEGRVVYLPEDMLLIRFRSAADYDLQPLTAGHHYIPLSLREFPLFVRKGQVLPLAAPAESTEELCFNAFTLLGWLTPGTPVTTELYTDDGISFEEGTVTSITLQPRGDSFTASAEGITFDCSRLITAP